MIIETLVGRYTVTAVTPDLESDLLVTADSRFALTGLLDAVELVGGALGHDRSFTDADIEELSLFGQTRFRTRVTRAELIQFIQAEVLSYLNYSTMAGFHRQQKQVL